MSALRTTRFRSFLLAVLGGCLVGAPAWAPACSVPVFRYALERWHADAYEAVVFHRGALKPAQKALVHDLEQNGLAGDLYANLEVEEVDLAADPDAALLKLWQEHPAAALPAVVLRYPRMFDIPINAWSGPLNETTIKQLLDSPLRRNIARQLVKGMSAVWVLLEIGDQARDDAAAKVLETRLQQLGKTMEAPKLDPGDVAGGLVSVSPEALKPNFSMVRLKRNDPAESALVEMLLGIEEDLHELKEPIAFPVFGRGRALFALVGKGIVPDNIDEACQFLSGPCSCQVKELNPGVDLLMAVNWDDEVYGSLVSTAPALPELTGVAGFAAETNQLAPQATAEPTLPPENAAKPPALANRTKREPTAKTKPSGVVAFPLKTAAKKEAEPQSVNRVMFSVAVVGGVVFVMALGGTLLLLRRKP